MGEEKEKENGGRERDEGVGVIRFFVFLFTTKDVLGFFFNIISFNFQILVKF